jgi:hypothetical protein
VTSYSLSLHEIDTVQDAVSAPNGGYVPNALEAVVRKRHLDMLQVWLVGGGWAVHALVWLACWAGVSV